MNIVCDENVRFNTISDGDVTIEIDGPLSPYTFTFTIDNTTGFETGTIDDNFKIQMDFQSSLLGENQETITVFFNNIAILEDIDRNYLQTEEESIEVPYQLVVLSDEEKAAANSQANTSLLSLILTFGTSLLFQFVMGGTIEATWLLLGTLQLMSLLPLLNLNLPANFREFSKNLSLLNGEPQAFPNIFQYYYDTLGIDYLPYNQYFEKMNFKTSYLLLNAGRKVMIWMAIFLASYITMLIADLIHEVGK